MPPSTSWLWPRPPPSSNAPIGPEPREGSPLTEPAEPTIAPRFAHESERQFAHLLDFYGVGWEYEPTEFILARDSNNRPAQAFRPDFYLPDYDLYIELTTLNQRLVTKKNRKVRRLRELHPEVKVKVLYQRDYLSLLMKFGFEGSADPALPAGV